MPAGTGCPAKGEYPVPALLFQGGFAPFTTHVNRSFMFSASCHYALLAMFYIGHHARPDKNVELRDIAEQQDIPRHFLSKILQQLVKHKLLLSTKGPNGGFRLSKPCDKITLIEIVEAIDGLDIFERCGIGFRQCDAAEPCPIHQEYKVMRDRVKQLFETKTLKILAREAQSGTSFVKLAPSARIFEK
jgi:Rrf2 family transcriptional regulator, iron-sulfur cluster assembly transcription factor